MKKNQRFMFVGVAMLTGALVIGCGSEETTNGVASWQGEEPHIAISGKLNGETLDISLSGAEAAEVAKLYCTREYTVPQDTDGNWVYTEGSMSELRINLIDVMVADEARDIQIEFKRHDFSADAIGATLNVIPRNDLVQPAASELWIEWEWYHTGELAADADAYYEQAAQEGTVDVMLFEGTVGDDGLTIPDNEGTVGLYADIYWSETEHIQISVTADCTDNDVSN